jgi:hypothetical protein
MNRRAFAARVPALTLVSLLVLFTMCDRPDRSPTAPERLAPPDLAGRATLVAPGTTDPQVLVGAGDIASCSTSLDEATAKLLDAVVAATPDATVFTAGDNAYDTGTSTEYSTCYGPTWGRHQARTYPAAGDRDYKTSGASGYFGYFGAAAGDLAKGYYSYDVGASWHVVVLNSKLSTSAGSAQEQWLKADLAASNRACTVAIWHVPRFSSSTTVSSSLKPVWDDLYKAGAELVLNAHYRNYERFAPQQSDGSADPDFGVREFVVGTGGAGSNSFGTILPNSEARNTGTRGVLVLTLDAGTYSWQFMPVAGKTYTDAGSGSCHGAPPPVAKAGSPQSGEADVTFDGSASSDPQGDTPLTYAWDFGDGSSGTGVKPTHHYESDGVYTVTLVVTDSKGNSSAPATTAATIVNVPPTVSVSDIVTHPGESASLTASISDPGEEDEPWSYSIDWGDGTAPDQGSTEELGTPLVLHHVYATLGQYTGTVTVTDKDGGVGASGFRAAVDDPALAQIFVGAGDIAGCTYSSDEATAKLLDVTPGTVFTLGDNAYPDGSASAYANCYNPTWGRHKARTYAALGNHEYDLGNATPAFDYFGDRVGPRGLGYYSFDLGDYWHIIVLNDNPSFVPFAAGSQQDQWLQADLAASTKRCTIAIWHQPYTFSSTSSTILSSSRKVLWDRLYAAGVELVLNGHVHQYERFAPQTPSLARDDAHGIRGFIVGTGGGGTSMPTKFAPNSEARTDIRGVLKLSLETDGYTWKFLPIAGKSFTDSGAGLCH